MQREVVGGHGSFVLPHLVCARQRAAVPSGQNNQGGGAAKRSWRHQGDSGTRGCDTDCVGVGQGRREAVLHREAEQSTRGDRSTDQRIAFLTGSHAEAPPGAS